MVYLKRFFIYVQSKIVGSESSIEAIFINEAIFIVHSAQTLFSESS